MKFIFIDETKNKRKSDFYGVCGVCIDEMHYGSISLGVTRCFQDVGWNTDFEFKGSYLFSHKKGDSSVTIDRRIELADKIIALNIAKKNAKMKAVFTWNEAGEAVDNHLVLVEEVLRRLLPSRSSRLSSKPCIVFTDQNDKIPPPELWRVINETLATRNYCLVEDVNIFRDWRSTHIGLCLCDLIAYLASWCCLSETPKEAQISLFTEESMSQYDEKKSEIVERIFQNIKNVKTMRISSRTLI